MSDCNCLTQTEFSAPNIALNGCPLSIPGECAYYSGLTVADLNILPGDNINIVINKIKSYFTVIEGLIAAGGGGGTGNLDEGNIDS